MRAAPIVHLLATSIELHVLVGNTPHLFHVFDKAHLWILLHSLLTVTLEAQYFIFFWTAAAAHFIVDSGWRTITSTLDAVLMFLCESLLVRRRHEDGSLKT